MIVLSVDIKEINMAEALSIENLIDNIIRSGEEQNAKSVTIDIAQLKQAVEDVHLYKNTDITVSFNFEALHGENATMGIHRGSSPKQT